jgi:hypothetical protein
LAHRASSALPKDYMRREAGRTLDDGVWDADIRNQLLLGGPQAGLRYAAHVPSSQTPENEHPGCSAGVPPPPTERKADRQPVCWCCARLSHFQGNCLSKLKETMNGIWEGTT